jgi:hypothetical protein
MNGLGIVQLGVTAVWKYRGITVLAILGEHGPFFGWLALWAAPDLSSITLIRREKLENCCLESRIAIDALFAALQEGESYP